MNNRLYNNSNFFRISGLNCKWVPWSGVTSTLQFFTDAIVSSPTTMAPPQFPHPCVDIFWKTVFLFIDKPIDVTPNRAEQTNKI